MEPTTAAIVIKVADYFIEREKAKENRRLADRSIGNVVKAVQSAKEEILSEIRDMRVRELAGNYIGLVNSVDNYLRITKTRNFLETILRDADALQGSLIQEASSSNYQVASGSFLILMATTSLRGIILSEFKYFWESDASAVNAKVLDEIKVMHVLSGNIIRLLKQRIQIWLGPGGSGVSSLTLLIRNWDTNENFRIGTNSSTGYRCLTDWLNTSSVEPIPESCRVSRNEHLNERHRTTLETMVFNSIKRRDIIPAMLATGQAANFMTNTLDRDFWKEYFEEWERIQTLLETR